MHHGTKNMGCACDVARGKAALILCNLVAQNLGAGRCAPWLVTSREEGFNGNRNQQNSLSTMEHGKVEIGASTQSLQVAGNRVFHERTHGAWIGSCRGSAVVRIGVLLTKTQKGKCASPRKLVQDDAVIAFNSGLDRTDKSFPHF